jgi:hypothetical protein
MGRTQISVFENRVLKGIFGHNRNELMGRLRKLHYEELYYAKYYQGD